MSDQLSILIAPQRHVLLALGSNLPQSSTEPSEILPRSLQALVARGVGVHDVSRLFRTPCFPPGAGPDYVNAAASLTTDLAPHDLLAILHDVEAEFGRERVQRWGSRVLDLDLLAWGDAVVPDRATFERWLSLPAERQRTETPDRLILPHPRLHERAFVLVPLAEVAPDWRHPFLGRTVVQMRDALPPEALRDIVPLE